MRLQVQGIHKRFGATRALQGVDLSIEAGEIHALIGENGAGKSTLMKVLSGACSPDEGHLFMEGHPFRPRNPQHARDSGIAMIYQELNLAPHLSVEENMVLGAEPSRWGWINVRQRRESALSALAQLDYGHLPLEQPIHRCTPAEMQIVEIARALMHEPKVLILDEPTSSLTQVDTERLFKVLRRLRDRGVSIVYISHFLEECRSLCDGYTVLRDGQTVGTGKMSSSSLTEIIRLMVGRDVKEIYPRTSRVLGQVVLRVDQVSGIEKPKSCSFELRRGEVLGIAGLVGAGRTEMVRACFGLDPLSEGRIWVRGTDQTSASPADRWNQGVGFLSESRKEEGLLLQRSIADNLMLTRFGDAVRWGWLRSGRQQAVARHCMTQLNIRGRDPWQSVTELSGGNQQKVFLGRLIHHDAEILLLDEPTRGIDVGSKAEIYRLIQQLAGQGKALVFISSYLPELMGVCDSLAVMCRGVLGAKRPIESWSEHDVISEAVGKGMEP